MKQWTIPHDEAHRFLDWGLRDTAFYAWKDYFDSKGIPYEVGGGRDSWTLYKHQLHTDMTTRKVTRCCPVDTEL